MSEGLPRLAVAKSGVCAMVEAMDFEAILSNWYNKSVKLIFEKQTLSIPDDSKK